MKFKDLVHNYMSGDSLKDNIVIKYNGEFIESISVRDDSKVYMIFPSCTLVDGLEDEVYTSGIDLFSLYPIQTRDKFAWYADY